LTFDYNLKIFKIAYPFGFGLGRESGLRVGIWEFGVGVGGKTSGVGVG
jgi:hypothetical protein